MDTRNMTFMAGTFLVPDKFLGHWSLAKQLRHWAVVNGENFTKYYAIDAVVLAN